MRYIVMGDNGFKELVVMLVCVLALILISDKASAYDKDSYWYAMIFAGKQSGNTWEDQGSMGNGFGVGYVGRASALSNIFYSVRYEHYSHLLVGQPFNGKMESWLDHVGVTLEYRW